MYGSTTTYMGGIGGAAMTEDTCDMCWGTGDLKRIGKDLRRLRTVLSQTQGQARAIEERLLEQVEAGTLAEDVADKVLGSVGALDVVRQRKQERKERAEGRVKRIL